MSEIYNNFPEEHSLDSMEGLETLPKKEDITEDYWIDLAEKIEKVNFQSNISFDVEDETIWVEEFRKIMHLKIPDEISVERKLKISEAIDIFHRQVTTRLNNLMSEIEKVHTDENPDFETYDKIAELYRSYTNAEHAHLVLAGYWVEKGNREMFEDNLSKAYPKKGFLFKKFLKDFDDRWTK